MVSVVCLSIFFLVTEVLLHLHENNSIAIAQATILYNDFESYAVKITTTCPMGQRTSETTKPASCHIWLMSLKSSGTA